MYRWECTNYVHENGPYVFYTEDDSPMFAQSASCPACDSTAWCSPVACVSRLDALLEKLVRRGIVTTNPSAAEACCGIARDADGFCQHRPYHPIYVPVQPETLH